MSASSRGADLEGALASSTRNTVELLRAEINKVEPCERSFLILLLLNSHNVMDSIE